MSNAAFSKESCTDESIGLDDSSHFTEKLYYRGTCHYRNEEYDLSAKYWGDLSDLGDIEERYEGFQIDSLNNLGYLKFYGLGISEDKTGAVFYWKKAISLGHYESEFHLCHAYADKDEPTFNYALGKKHCEKAFLIYNGMEETDEEIMKSIKKYRSSLNNH
jgi:TPR repeat protein